MGKHTDGQWFVRGSLEPYIGAENGAPVITGRYDGSLYVENDADLFLAAAAPELLQALQSLVGQIDHSFEFFSLDIAEAKAAIAKATTGQKNQLNE